MREARKRECNARVEAVGGIREEINNIGKEMELEQDETVTYGSTFASTNSKVRRHAYDIYGVR